MASYAETLKGNGCSSF